MEMNILVLEKGLNVIHTIFTLSIVGTLGIAIAIIIQSLIYFKDYYKKH